MHFREMVIKKNHSKELSSVSRNFQNGAQMSEILLEAAELSEVYKI